MLKVARRSMAALAVGASLGVVFASGAAAWTFATTDSPLKVVQSGVTQGAAVGYIYRSGYNYVYFEAAVRDYNPTDSAGIYAKGVTGKTGAGLSITSTPATKSTAWKWMPTKKVYFGAAVGGSVGATGKAEVCEEVPWRWDRCVSSATRFL